MSLPMAKQLTAKQERFAQEYLIDLNASRAAIRAGYSKKTARSQGQRLLTNADIRKFICEKRQALSAKTEITIELAIKALWDSAHRCLQLKPVLNSDGQQMIVDVPEDLIPVYGDTVAAMVKHDPAAGHKALELVLRHLGAFPTKVELTGRGGGPIETKTADITDKEVCRMALYFIKQNDDRLEDLKND